MILFICNIDDIINDEILLFKLNFILEKNIYWMFKLLISNKRFFQMEDFRKKLRR